MGEMQHISSIHVAAKFIQNIQLDIEIILQAKRQVSTLIIVYEAAKFIWKIIVQKIIGWRHTNGYWDKG